MFISAAESIEYKAASIEPAWIAIPDIVGIEWSFRRTMIEPEPGAMPEAGPLECTGAIYTHDADIATQLVDLMTSGSYPQALLRVTYRTSAGRYRKTFHDVAFCPTNAKLETDPRKIDTGEWPVQFIPFMAHIGWLQAHYRVITEEL